MQKFQIKLSSFGTFYLFNIALIALFLSVVATNFFVQFQTESMQEKIAQNKNEVVSYRDQIAMLEVEWAYLTRPSRIRELSERFLENNGYSLASQIKSEDEMSQFFLANFQGEERQEVAANF